MMSSMESSPQSGLPGSISGRQTMLGENDDKQKNTDPEGKTKQKNDNKDRMHERAERYNKPENGLSETLGRRRGLTG